MFDDDADDAEEDYRSVADLCERVCLSRPRADSAPSLFRSIVPASLPVKNTPTLSCMPPMTPACSCSLSTSVSSMACRGVWMNSGCVCVCGDRQTERERDEGQRCTHRHIVHRTAGRFSVDRQVPAGNMQRDLRYASQTACALRPYAHLSDG